MKVWIYLDGRQQGPFEMEDLPSKPGFNQNTRVWFEGLPKWYPAGSLEQLAPLFGQPQQTPVYEQTEVCNECCEEQTKNTEVCDSAAEESTPAYEEPQSRYAPGRIYRPVQELDEPCPPTYLGWSVFLIICCCSPASLAALAASICVSSFYSQGNLDKAKKASEWAAWLIMISFALGMIPMMMMNAFLS